MGLFDLFRRSSKPSPVSGREGGGEGNPGYISDLVQHARENVWNSNAGDRCPAENFSMPQESGILMDGVHRIPKDDLPDSVKNNFTNGNYDTVVTDEPMTLYRSFGGNAYSDGSYWTTEKPGDPM